MLESMSELMRERRCDYWTIVKICGLTVDVTASPLREVGGRRTEHSTPQPSPTSHPPPLPPPLPHHSHKHKTARQLVKVPQLHIYIETQIN